MITIVYLAFLAFSCAMSLANWRKGVYLAIVIDVLRDPIRKLTTDEPIWITLSGLAIWAFVFLGLYQSKDFRLREWSEQFPKLVVAIRCVVLAVIPGALISLISYSSGYKLAILGIVSYIAPFAGVAIGIAFVRVTDDIFQLLGFYILVNTISFAGVFAEYLNLSLPALGGLENFRWIRTFHLSHIPLICGFFRGPDILALHAAHVVIFTFCFIIRSRNTTLRNAGVIAIALTSLLLAGRRKMMIMPVVFLGSYLTFSGRQSKSAVFPLFVLAVIIAVSVALVGSTQEKTLIPSAYVDYGSSLIDDGLKRAHDSVLLNAMGTFFQVGIFGNGLGSATQGGRYTNVATGGWQEDGVSRAFAELGVPGIALVLIGGIHLIGSVRDSRLRIANNLYLSMLSSLLISIVVADFSSYLISHQHFSGDPGSGVLVLVMLGMAIGLQTLNAPERHLREF